MRVGLCFIAWSNQAIVGCTPGPTYPVMGNPALLGLFFRGYLWVCSSPRIPRVQNKYHGYTVTGTPNCPLIKATEFWHRDRPKRHLMSQVPPTATAASNRPAALQASEKNNGESQQNIQGGPGAEL